MKTEKFRRSNKVEDYRDINKPVAPDDLSDFYESINEMLKITNSQPANDLGANDIIKRKPDGS